MKVSLLRVKQITKWLLLILTLLFVITGFGITQFQIVEKLTLGLLTKSLSFKIHTSLIIPFLILLFIHVYLSKRGNIISS